MATGTDGSAAHDILLNFGTLSQHGACWHYVWQAYAAAGASTDAPSTPTAYQGWQATQGQHPGDRNPPKGAAIWLGRRYDGNMDGDVFIAGAYDGDHSATDQPVYGYTGLTSIQARLDLCGREYLGWSDHVLDCPIALGGSSVQSAQRQVLPSDQVNARSEPSSQAPLAGDPLPPNTIGNFTGWIHGEAVSGDDVWFLGTSGRWFWSGGFTDTGVHDLTDLN